jgi:ATP-GRASP peptide maturase of grasp-with-spasm system
MILLLSQLYFDPSTDEVIDWLDFLGANWERVNGLEFVEDLKISDDNHFVFEHEKIDWKDVNVVWFRRWLSRRGMESILRFEANNDEDREFIGQIKHFQKSELNCLFEYFFENIHEEKKFSKMTYGEINKLSVLREAKKAGLRIPKSTITSSKKDFLKLQSSCSSIITKAIGNANGLKSGKEVFKGYTSIVHEIPDEVGSNFFPTLFQENIDKKFEIRSFFINKQIYSMAIFSQNDDQTKIDFRQYNEVKPNRFVPYKLPDSIEEKLIDLAERLDLNSGSFDIIKSINNEYVFLEVNPGGQFGMVSYPCNYNLEKILANELINLHETNNSRKN